MPAPFFVEIDLAGGADAHRQAVAVFADARLDNRRELSGVLALPPSPSDTELIRAAYLRWGDRCPEHFLGDFAFVIWEPKERRLFGASDPLGVRPLYYWRTGSRLLVSPDLSHLLGNPGVPRRIDPIAVSDYLAAIASEPERTFFQDVHRLPPGHSMTATPEGIRLHRYWDIDPKHRLEYRREEDYAAHFLELLRQSVRDRLPEEGVTGVAVSGGLDSTSVAAVAAREMRSRGSGSLLACSFVFNQLSECDERPYIQDLATNLGLETAFIDAERFWFLGDDQAYVPPADTPMMSWESPFRQLLGALRERGGRVLLTGHGADDLLLGSRLAYADRFRRGDLRVVQEIWSYSRGRRYGWRPFYKLLAEPWLGSAAPALRRILNRSRTRPAPEWIAPDFARETRLAERLAEAERGPERKTAFHQMYERLIARPSYHRSVFWYDRNSSPFGIEARHPFLDRRLFDFVFAVPPEALIRLGERKSLLRRAVAGILPDAVRLRPRKTQLGAFVDLSLQKEAERVQKLLEAPVAAEIGWLNAPALQKAFASYFTDEPDEARRALWYAITLELWLRHHPPGGASVQRPAA